MVMTCDLCSATRAGAPFAGGLIQVGTPEPRHRRALPLRNLLLRGMDLLVPGRVEPVRRSPRAIAYGSFAQGTDPHDRPYSSGVVPRADHLCRPPSPAHPAADRSVTRLSPRFRYYSAV